MPTYMDGAGGNDGIDDVSPVGSFILRTPCRFAYGSRYYLRNKNTTPERGVVSATYPNDTSAARCIGRRQRHTIHMGRQSQVSVNKARHRRDCVN